jgi:hypothetical protein
LASCGKSQGVWGTGPPVSGPDIARPLARNASVGTLRYPARISGIFRQEFLESTPLSGAPLTALSITTTGTVDLAPIPAGLERLALASCALRDATALGRFHLRELVLDGYHGAQAIDLARIDGSRLERLSISHSDALDLRPLSALRIIHVSGGYNGDLDLSPLAACPVVEVDMTITSSAVTWRSLKAFRQTATLAAITINGNRRSAAEFWDYYRANAIVEAIRPGTLTVVPGTLVAITPPATQPGLAWEAMDGIHQSVAELAQAKVVARGSSGTIELTQPFSEFRGLRYGGYLTVPIDGDYTFTVTSDDGSRLLIGDRLLVDNDRLHAPTAVSGRIRLTAGAHPFTLLYFNGEKGSALAVTVKGPALPEKEIPPHWLSH